MLLPFQTSGTKHSVPRKPHWACAECGSHLRLKTNRPNHGSHYPISDTDTHTYTQMQIHTTRLVLRYL